MCGADGSGHMGEHTMKILYLDCAMGAAGDMLTGALLDLMDDPETCVSELNRLGLPGIRYEMSRTVKCGIRCRSVKVTFEGHEEHPEMHFHTHNGGHSHHGMHDIRHMTEHLPVPDEVKERILSVYGRIADAESRVHGVAAEEVHFHEVGAMDAIADVTAVCWLMNRLRPDRVIVSAVNTGSGHVKCAHGILPVPAPATAFLLQDVPVFSSGIMSELCTPTGAALLTCFADRYGDMPVMRLKKIGYGAGKKDFETLNAVRALLGETADAEEIIAGLECNVDDMTAEDLAYASERLFEAGAREVYTTSVGMKKSRSGILLSVMCPESRKDEIIRLIFRHTTTIGIRENMARRYVMKREIKTVSTSFGPVRCKISSGYGTTRVKYEYEDLAEAARRSGCSLEEVRRRIREELPADASAGGTKI